ncbi:hypothetical protein ACHAXR_000475, partial [Thalassiosira sp. AJA248-18]
MEAPPTNNPPRPAVAGIVRADGAQEVNAHHVMHLRPTRPSPISVKSRLLFFMGMIAIVNCDNVLAFQTTRLLINYNNHGSTTNSPTWRNQPPVLSSSFRPASLPACTNSQSRLMRLQMMSNNNNNNDLLPAPLQILRSSPSTKTITAEAADDGDSQIIMQSSQIIQLETLSRILLPSLLSSLAAFFLFPPVSLGLSYLINDSATFAVLAVDSSQFIQNFLTVTGLTFSILVGQTYYFMYQQQEAVFVSLFGEVTEAKSLLEQVALVCQGRRDMYEMCLVAIK